MAWIFLIRHDGHEAKGTAAPLMGLDPRALFERIFTLKMPTFSRNRLSGFGDIREALCARHLLLSGALAIRLGFQQPPAANL